MDQPTPNEHRGLWVLVSCTLVIALAFSLGTAHWVISPFASVLVAADGTVARTRPLPDWGTGDLLIAGQDRLLALDDRPVPTGRALLDQLAGYLPGERAILTFSRETVARNLVVTVRRLTFNDVTRVVGPFAVAGWGHIGLAVWLLRRRSGTRTLQLLVIYCLATGAMILSQLCGRTGHALDAWEQPLLQAWALALVGLAGSFAGDREWRRFRWGWLACGALLLALDAGRIRAGIALWPVSVVGGCLALLSVGCGWGYAAVSRPRGVIGRQARFALAAALIGLTQTAVWLGSLVDALLGGTTPPPGMPDGAMLTLGVLPIGLAIAVFRPHTLDLAALVRRALAATALAVSLIGLYLLSTSTFSLVVLDWMEVDADVGLIFTCVVLALLVNPLQQGWYRLIDMTLFPRRLTREALVAAYADSVTAEPSLERLQDGLLTTVQTLCQPTRIALWVLAPGQTTLSLAFGDASDADLALTAADVAAQFPFADWDLARTPGPVAQALHGRGYLVVLPLRLPHTPVGMLALGERDGHTAYGIDERRWLSLLSAEASLILHNRLLVREKEVHIARLETLLALYTDAEHRASLDGLTGVDNRVTFDRRLVEALSRFRRYGEIFSLMMLDIDWFKAVNDTHGHLIGDRVLQAIAESLKAGARDTDCVARYGGEEFALILPHTDQDGALTMAERIRQSISELRVSEVGCDALRITVSVGLAGPHPEDVTAADVIRRADRALYDAKATGRNRVVTCA